LTANWELSVAAEPMQLVIQLITRLIEENPDASSDEICEEVLREMRRDVIVKNAVVETVFDSLSTIAEKLDRGELLTDDERESFQEAMVGIILE
jgi:hypothetical protein